MAWLAHVVDALGALLGFMFLGALITLVVVTLLFCAAFVGLGFLVGARHLFDRSAGRKTARREPEFSPEGRQLRARMRRLARSTLLLAPTREPAFSKLGGRPELPSDSVWPAVDGEPRSFLAQIDLKELRDAGGPDWLPAEGRLYAFKDSTGFGRPDDTAVFFSANPPGPEVAPPASLESKHRFGERRAHFLPMTTFPSLDWLDVDLATLDLTDTDLDELANAPNEPFGDELQHRIGGYPTEIQDGQMQIECEFLARRLNRNYREPVPDGIARASKQWRLLLQIDSDPALGMNWGDGGRLYVFIKEKHARVGDFSKTVSLWQTY